MAATTSSTNLSNWRTSPNSQYAFQHVDELIPVKHIAKSSQPTELKQAARPLDANLKIPISTDRPIKGPEPKVLSITEILAATATDGFVCVHDGELIFEHYANNNSKDSKHIVFSVSKSMTGLVAGALINKGMLALDDKVPKHLPELIRSAYATVTVRHLLDMRSGIIYDDTTPEYRAASGWAPHEAGKTPPEGLLRFLSTFNPPDIDEPGSGFVYASVNTDVLGLILERTSGKTLAELIHEYLWQPAGAESDAYITVDSAGNPRAAGGLCTTTRDLARIGQALIDGKVASKSWLDDMLHGGDKQVFAESAWGPAFGAISKNLTYRSCWTVDGDVGLLIAMGIHGQMLFVDIPNKLIVAKTSSQGDRSDFQAWGLSYRLFKTIQASRMAQQ